MIKFIILNTIIFIIVLLVGFILGFNYLKRKAFFGGFLILTGNGGIQASFESEEVLEEGNFITLKIVSIEDVKDDKQKKQ